MNTYRVTMRVQSGRVRRYDVDATWPGVAIKRGLEEFTTPLTSDVDVSCRLFAKDIERDYSAPKVRVV